MKYIERKDTESVKYDKEAIKSFCSNENAEPLWVADMDFEIAKPALDRIKQLNNIGIYGYPNWKDQKKIVRNWLIKRHNYDIPEDQIAISPGVLTSIAICLEQLDGDTVIIPRPAYKPFVSISDNFNKKVIDWPLIYDSNKAIFSLNFDSLEKLTKKEENKILIFCSPQNPTSLVFSEEELDKVASICKKNNVVVLSDEIHADLVYPEFKHITFNQVAKKVDIKSIVFMAPSKTFNIAGEHYSISLFNSKKECQAFETRLNQLHLGYSSLTGGLLALACYEEGLPWLNDAISTLQENADFIDDFFKDHIPEMKFIYPKASFITFIDCTQLLPLVEKDALANPDLYDPSLSENGCPLSRFFGQRAGICMNAGTWFGEDYNNFVRINFATSKTKIEKALLDIQEAVNQLKKKYQAF